MAKIGMVSFIGAGPGDPELLTIKGRNAIAAASLVLYAGSLVPAAIAALAGKEARVVDSAPLTLEESHALVAATAFAGKDVARVHTGDPAIYGALSEQAALLEAAGIPWRVIPGVTAACAAAAAAGVSFTYPEISQTLIITRIAGATPMPAAENIASLAAHKTSMAIYLSGKKAVGLQSELEKALPPETPILCARRVGWPEEKLVWTTLKNLAETAAKEGMGRQTLFLVLPGHNREGRPSRLYSASFGHEFRAACKDAITPAEACPLLKFPADSGAQD